MIYQLLDLRLRLRKNPLATTDNTPQRLQQKLPVRCGCFAALTAADLARPTKYCGKVLQAMFQLFQILVVVFGSLNCSRDELSDTAGRGRDSDNAGLSENVSMTVYFLSSQEVRGVSSSPATLTGSPIVGKEYLPVPYQSTKRRQRDRSEGSPH